MAGKKRQTPEQIVRILREAETTNEAIDEFCRRKEISKVTYYRWKAQFGDMDVSEVKQLKEVTQENARLKRLLAEALLANDLIQETLAKKR